MEVKARLSEELNAPERAIDPEKMIALRRAARDYARRADAQQRSMRFDVIAIAGRKLEYFPDAFGSGETAHSRQV